jgi:hypothetical protein
MLEFLKKEANRTYTENYATTNKSTNNNCLDFFYHAGALRSAEDTRIISIFSNAYSEDPSLALKILFFVRDIRGGLGERRVFRTCINWLAINHSSILIKNLGYIAEFGRYDDLLFLFNSSCEDSVMKLIARQLAEDIKAMEAEDNEVSLLAKWLPSVNTSNKLAVTNAKKIARALKLTDSQYRKTLSRLRRYINIIENHLREINYTFDYEKQPSKAMFKYKKAFIRNDKDRYMEFIARVQVGEADLKTGSLYPYDIVREAWLRDLTKEERISLDVTWKNLTSYGNDENAIVVIDGSGSMYNGLGTPKPIEAALSLGIYFAEHNVGKFKNHFITFSITPKLVEVKGRDIVEKVRYAASFNEVANTNIEAVFKLILNTAVRYKLPQSEMPSKIYIISDMEFDTCTENASLSNFENAKALFTNKGYTLPNIVFWNVQSRNDQVPVTLHETGVALVSGASPKIFDMVKSSEIDPMKLMLEIANNDRYKKITA